MKNIKKQSKAIKLCIQNAGFGLGFLLMAPLAMAQDAGDIANNVKETGTSLLDMIYVLMAIVGFVMFVSNGVKLLSERKQQQDSDISTWKQFAAGIFLMAPLIFLSAFFNSVTGEKSSVDSIKASMQTQTK